MSDPVLGLVALFSISVCIFIGFPISFILILLSIIFGYLGMGSTVFNLMVLQFFSVMKDPTFSAVPFFLFMGYLLEQAGLMDRLFKAFQLLLAPVRGSLYIAVLVTATIFAAATGIVGSSVTLLGVMAGPSMKRSKYDVKLSAGVITAGGTLGILIPPSVMLVIMAPILGVPVTELLASAFLPGFLLASLYLGYSMIRCYVNPRLGPPLPPEERASSLFQVFRELIYGVVPIGTLIAVTLGSILAGLATPTEAAACGAFGAFVMTLAYKRMTWARLKESVYQTTIITSMALYLAASSTFFGAVFSRLGSADMLTQALLGLSIPPLLMIFCILGLIFVLGWPLEFLPIILIVMPIFSPIVQKLGFDLVWFGTVVAMVLQTCWLSPPVALSAYFLKAVVPDWELKDIYAGMIQFMMLQVLGFTIVVLFPSIALFLPTILFR